MKVEYGQKRIAGDTVTRPESIHDAGVKRHPSTWFTANLKASQAMTGFGLTEKQFKEMVPLIVLRVLDAVETKSGK